MRTLKSLFIAGLCLIWGFNASVSLAQQAQDDFSAEDLGAGANLVVTSVSGPTSAIHNQTISVTYSVRNKGTVASGAYKVGLYLSTDDKIEPAADRLLDKVTFSKGLEPGKSRKTTAKVLVPINGLSGKYYYGAVVASSKKASSQQLSLVRYSLADDNDTVTDHKTGLIWQRTDDGIVKNWADANEYCADLILGGKADWRLPGIDELVTIIDYSRYDPPIDLVFECRSDYYWSSMTVANGPDAAWDVSFYGGYVDAYGKSDDHYVRCVRSRP